MMDLPLDLWTRSHKKAFKAHAPRRSGSCRLGGLLVRRSSNRAIHLFEPITYSIDYTTHSTDSTTHPTDSTTHPIDSITHSSDHISWVILLYMNHIRFPNSAVSIIFSKFFPCIRFLSFFIVLKNSIFKKPECSNWEVLNTKKTPCLT